MRCYFNLVNGTEEIIDDDGIEVSGIEQARAQALKAIAELRHEDNELASEWKNWRLEVTDQRHRIIHPQPRNRPPLEWVDLPCMFSCEKRIAVCEARQYAVAAHNNITDRRPAAAEMTEALFRFFAAGSERCSTAHIAA